MTKLAIYAEDPSVRIVTGACPHDCPDTCSWQIAVDRTSGRALDIWGHADHPVTQGALCGKVDRYLERVYHADRLTHPLRRVGPKGGGRFERISWGEALEAIAGRLQGIIDEWGAEAVLPYAYAGTMGWLQQEGMSGRFFRQMGASRLARTICSEAGFEGYLYTIGSTIGIEAEDFAHARLILIWGSNTLTSNLHLWPFIQAARKQGARVVVVDPARTRTARAADEWIPIRPGTDGALALGMMHEIINTGLHDSDYVAAYTVGFEQLAARVQEWTPQRAAQITGIAAGRISELARAYATTRPAAIRVNYGMQRHYGGGMAMRNITCLPALVGAWRERGGGIQLSTSGQLRHLETSGLQRPDLHGPEGAARMPRTINMNRLGDALSLERERLAASHYAPRPVDCKPTPAEAGPPVKALIVYNSNPAAVAPDQAAVLAGLAREELFTVVLEHFQTDTADYADYVLPATTQAEHWDLQRMYGHHYVALNRPAIAPVGEARPNSAIFRGLAQAMGYTDSGFYEGDETVLRNFVEAQRHPLYAPVTWEALLEKGFVRLNLPQPYLPFAAGDFPTPSGKCEFYSERMARDGYDPLPTYTAPNSVADGRWPVAGGKGERAGAAEEADSWLACISPPAHSFLNSSFSHLERLRGREREPLLWIHPEDASVRRIEEGARLRVWNGLGEVGLTARVTDDIMPGTVLAPGIWWNKHSADGRNVNQLTPQDETDMGASGSFYDVRVRVESI